jgi:hypothetical protein
VERVSFSVRQVVENFLRNKKADQLFDKMIDFYREYLRSEIIITDLSFENIGYEPQSKKFKIIDWFRLIDKGRYTSDHMVKMCQLELSVQLANNLEIIKQELVDSGQWGVKMEKNLKLLTAKLTMQLELQEVKDRDEFLTDVYRSIVVKMVNPKTLLDL